MRKLVYSLFVVMILSFISIAPVMAINDNSAFSDISSPAFQSINDNSPYQTFTDIKYDNGSDLPDGLTLAKGSPFISSSEAKKGDSLTIKLRATNDSAFEINYTLKLYINDKSAGSKQLSLAPGNSEDIVFPIVAETTGTNNVRIGNLTGVFAVKGGSLFDSVPVYILVFIGIVLVVIIMFVVLIVTKPKSKKKTDTKIDDKKKVKGKEKGAKPAAKGGVETQFPMPSAAQQTGAAGSPAFPGASFGGQQPQPGMQQFPQQQPQPGMQQFPQQQPQPGMQQFPQQQPQPGMQQFPQQQPQPGMQQFPQQQPQPGMQQFPQQQPQPGMQPTGQPSPMRQQFPGQQPLGPNMPQQFPPAQQPGAPTPLMPQPLKEAGMPMQPFGQQQAPTPFGQQQGFAAQQPQPGFPQPAQKPPFAAPAQPQFPQQFPSGGVSPIAQPQQTPVVPQPFQPAQQQSQAGRYPTTGAGMPRFSVSNFTVTPGAVKVGETVGISAIVANNGVQSGKYSVVLRIGGVVENISDVTLPPGVNQTVSFTIAKDTAGEYYADIDGIGGFFTVIPLTPPSFEVSNFSIKPERVSQGQPVSVNATVTNTGELQGTHTLTLRVKGQAESQQQVDLAPGKSQNIEFQVVKDAPGFYPVSLENLTGKFVVEMDWKG